MATTIKVTSDVREASKGVDQLAKQLDKVGDAAEQASKDADRSMDDLTESLKDVAKNAGAAGKSVEEIADAQAVADINDLASQMASLSNATKQIESTSTNAAKSIRDFAGQSKFAGETTGRVADAAFDFAKNLGSGGVAGAAQAVLPKLASLTGHLAGPWGVALTFAVGVLGQLISEMGKSEEATEEYKQSLERLKQSSDSYLESLKSRIRSERELQRDLAAGEDRTVNRLEDDLEVQRQVIRDLQAEQERLERRKQSIPESDGTAAGQANRLARFAKETAAAAKNQIALNQALKEQGQIEKNLGRATESQQKRRGREAEAANRQLRENDEIAAQQSQKQAQKQLEDLQKNLLGELDPASANRQKIDDEKRSRLDALEQMKQVLKLTNEEHGRLLKQINEAHIKDLKKLQESAEAKQNAPNSNQSGVLPEVLTPDQRKLAEANAQHALNSLTPRQVVDQLAKQRISELPIHKEIEQAQYEARHVTGDQSEVRRLQRQLAEESKYIQRESFRDVHRGKVNPDEQQTLQQEIGKAQQGAVQEMLKNAQANGQLSGEMAQAISSATSELTKLSNDVGQLQQQVIAAQQQLNATSQFNNRRRAQRGGGR